MFDFHHNVSFTHFVPSFIVHSFHLDERETNRLFNGDYCQQWLNDQQTYGQMKDENNRVKEILRALYLGEFWNIFAS